MKRSFLALPLCASLLFVSPLWAQAVPTFVGVRTFLGAPYVTNLEKLDADFAVLGVPFDEGTWGQPGERYGPRDMREASQEYNHDLTEGFYYIDGDRTVLKGKHWADVGDIEIWPTVPAQTNDKVTAAVKTILAHKAFPIVIGGDHSIRTRHCAPSTSLSPSSTLTRTSTPGTAPRATSITRRGYCAPLNFRMSRKSSRSECAA